MQLVYEWTYGDLMEMVEYLKTQQTDGRANTPSVSNNSDGTITRRYTIVG